MDLARYRWGIGPALGGLVTAAAWVVLTPPPVVLLTLAVTWTAVGVTYASHPALLFGRGNRWSGAFAGVLTFALVSFQSLDASLALVTALALLTLGVGTFAFGAGVAFATASGPDGDGSDGADGG